MMDDIPFSCVPMMTWQSLANKLDPDSPLMGNNWKMLAEKLGYTTEQILCLESRHTSHGRNTLKLFEEYVKKRDSTVKNLKKALEEMDRPDALQVLLDAMPDIEQQYQRELNNRRIKSEPDENSWPASCQNSCSSGFFNGPIPGQNPSLLHQHQSYHHQIQAHTFMPSISHVAMSGGTVCHVPEKELNIPQNHNYYSQHVSQPPSYRPSTNHSQSTSRIHNPTTSRIHGTSHSMVVHVDPQEIANNISDIDMMEMNIPVTEDAAPLPRAIMRGQNINVPRLMNPQEMLVGREVTVGTSSSPQPETPCQFPARYERQVSEECNSRQPSGVENKNKNVGLSVQCSKAKAVSKQNCEFVSPGPTPTSVPSTPLGRLKQFTDSETYMPTEEYKTMMEEKLREEVLYNRAYGDEIHNKLRAETQQRKINDSPEDSFRSIFKFNRSSNIPTVCRQPQGNAMSLKSCVEKEIPKTFPLRAKSLGSCSSENNQDRPSILPKSQSLPNDMKPAEYKRAFRHIKVFVTYSDDCKRHLQRVLNLCRCLEKNGFTCCMDMYGRKMQVTDKIGWLDQRFKEADFILVCISPGYKSDIENCESDTTVEFSDNALHTPYIYKLMTTEFQEHGQRNSRFVPLMFEGAEKKQIPSWLENGLVYSWPTQYRDLLWFLTKPETRVKAKKANMSEGSPPSPGSYFDENNI